jgi:pyruvate formate lyase activating enzyme
MHDAKYWDSAPEGDVLCRLCPRACLIGNGEAGFCGVRVNSSGALYSAVYAQASAIAVDPIEKKPLYHFHPGTTSLSFGTLGCNMRCRHCQNYDISYAYILGARHRDTTFVAPDSVVPMMERAGALSVSFTYNEPTIWIEYMLDVFELVMNANRFTVVVTNGFINREPLADLLKVTDAYRVDLKFMSKRSALLLADVPDHTVILRRIMQAKEAGVHLEIVTNIVTGVNDSASELAEMARWIAGNPGIETPWHLTKSFPKPQWLTPATSTRKLLEAVAIARSAGLCYVYPGNVTEMDANTHCPHCDEVVVKRDGYQVEAVRTFPYCGRCKRKMNFVVRGIMPK